MFSKIKKALVFLTIMVLTIQSSMILSFLNPQKAMAATTDITQLSFTTTPQTISQNTISDKMAVQTQNDSNLPEAVSETTHLDLTTTSLTGEFSSSDTTWTATTTLTMNSTWTNRSFYYKDATPGMYTITISAEGKTWAEATQNITITAPDTIAPVITLIGATTQTIEKNDTYTELGATATDDVDGDISTNIVKDISDVDTSTVGIYEVTYNVADAAGNSAQEVVRIVNVVDNTAPIGSIVINDGADVTNSKSVTLKLKDLSNPLDAAEVAIWGDGEMFQPTTTKNWIAFNDEMSINWLLNDGDGMKTFYAEFKDESGNVSPVYSDSIFASQYNSDENPHALTQGPNVVDPFNNGNVEITMAANSPTTLFASTYSENPVGLKSGINFLNKYYDFSLANDSAIDFPVFIKFYYTLDDLTAAGITSESQLLGLYYYDHADNTWKIYSADGQSTTGVDTNDVNGYAGYVRVNAYHFTPMAIGADITAPTKPANFTATAKDGGIELTWDKVDGASGYYVRYREGTSIDNKDYSIVYLNGIDTLNTKVSGLKNSTLYEFGVQAIDEVGNLSEWAVVVSSPAATFTLAKAEKITFVASYQVAQASSTDEGQISNGETEITTIGPDEGQIKSESAFSWSRFWITLAILLIAAGAAYGGYYGYQWWMDKPKKTPKNTTPKPPTNNTDKTDKTGRW